MLEKIGPLVFCSDCPAPHQCAEADECCAEGFEAAKVSVTRREQWIEAAAKAIYDLDPFCESGEYVDGFIVSPGGNLTWDQARQRDAEFSGVHGFLPVTKFARDAAEAALTAIGL
jgi:hypothetical protein